MMAMTTKSSMSVKANWISLEFVRFFIAIWAIWSASSIRFSWVVVVVWQSNPSDLRCKGFKQKEVTDQKG